MFERKIYKKQAIEQLKNNWMQPVLVGLVIWGLLYGLSLIMPILMLPVMFMSMPLFMLTIDTNSEFFTMFLVMLIMYIPLIIGYMIFYSITNMSQSFFYISFIKNKKSPVTTFMSGFSLWSKGLLGYLWMLLWTSLWSLLLVVPGIIKSIAYSQIFFIIADNPTIGVRRAMKLSMAITDGHKGELFVMSLSFLGWSFLALISLGIGFLWLTPYQTTSFAYAYQYMKQNALDRNVLTHADFGQEKSVVAIDETTTE